MPVSAIALFPTFCYFIAFVPPSLLPLPMHVPFGICVNGKLHEYGVVGLGYGSFNFVLRPTEYQTPFVFPLLLPVQGYHGDLDIHVDDPSGLRAILGYGRLSAKVFPVAQDPV